MDGIKLQEDLTGHAVKEGDIGQGSRRQEEHFTTGRGLTQLWEKKKDVTYQTAGVLIIHRNIQNASKANHKIYGWPPLFHLFRVL